MAKGISLDILANTRQAQAGIKDVGAELEKVADSLDDVAKDAQTSGDKVETAFDGVGPALDGMAREGDQATEKLERSFKDLADVSKREAKQGGDAIAKEYKEGAKKAEASLDDVKEEAKGTARETAASFDGSFESVLGGLQEVTANAGATFGPAGFLAGAAAAAGIGIVTEALGVAGEAAEEAKQALVDMYKEAAAEGRDFVTEAQITANALEITFDPARKREAEEYAKAIGVDVDTAIRALAGDQEALNTTLEVGKRKQDELAQAAEGGGRRASTAEDQKIIGVQKANAAFEEQRKQHEINADAARVAGRITRELQERAREAAIKTTGGFLRQGEKLDDLAGKLRSMPDANVSVNVDSPNFPALHRDWQGRIRAMGPLVVPTVASKLLGVPVP